MNTTTQDKPRPFNLMNKIKTSLVSIAPSINFPQEGEKVNEGGYAIRISAEPNSDVEISINKGQWQPCRASIGYWWFDWQAKGKGLCKLVARSHVGKGRWKKSGERLCEITGSEQQ